MSAGGGVILSLTTAAGAHNVAASLSYDATPFPGGTFVELNCKAVATVDPASTGIDDCSVNGQSAIGSPNNTPGPVAVAAGVVFVPDGADAYGCVSGHAHFAEAILGPLDMATDPQCKPLLLVTVADSAGQ